MKKKLPSLLITLALLSTLDAQFSTAFAQGTTFIYQGRLSDGGQPANGTNYGMFFYLYDAPTNGTLVGNEGIVSVTVSNGLFTVPLSFDNAFDGNPRWLEISVQKNGGSFTTLSPRQPILPVPYAIFANTASNLSGTLPAVQLNGAIADANLPDSPSFTGIVAANAFAGNAGDLTNLNPANLASGYVPGPLYLTNEFNGFSGSFFGFHGGNGGGLTNLNPANLTWGYAPGPLYLTNQFNGFSGSFFGFHGGDGGGLTNLNPANLTWGYAPGPLYLTNQFNGFSGSFFGFHGGDGGGLTNLNPANLTWGYAPGPLYLTNQFNGFSGSFFGFHGGDGGGLTNLNPANLASGYVPGPLYLTNEFNGFSGSFTGYHSGDGGGLTNVSINAITGGITTNILIDGHTFYYTNGVLMNIQ